LLRLFSEEEYDPVSETVIPKNSRAILLQSRQTGKCLKYNSTISLENNT
jgi:hypothetical protein